MKYNTDMDTYLTCIKGEYDTKVAAHANADAGRRRPR